MSQCVPSWDMDDINPNHAVLKFGYEMAELTWENGQVAMQELGSQRVPTKSQPTTSWENPSAAETLESIVDEATLQPYCKTQVAAEEDELVPWLHHHHHRIPIVAAGSLNAATPTRTSDALVPISNSRTDADQAHRARDVGCSTLVGSCSSYPSAFMENGVARGGESTKPAHDWSSRGDMSVSRKRTFETLDTRDGDLGDCLLTSTSTELPESTSSGRDCSKSRCPDDSVCHCKTQDGNAIKEKKRGKTKASISNRRRRTAAIHNQSERKRRDKINQRMKTLQKLVPNSSKTDKASMLDEVVEYIKQLQSQVHMMNMSPMMSFVMQQQQQQRQQQQQQMHMSMINSMCMGTGMGMGGIDMNTMGLPNISPGFHPSMFMHMPSWNNHTNNQAVNTNTMTANPMSAFLACRPQQMNMDSYNRMAALYQHMLNQSYGQFSKN